MSKNLYYMGLNTASKHYFFYSIFNELLIYCKVYFIWRFILLLKIKAVYLQQI